MTKTTTFLFILLVIGNIPVSAKKISGTVIRRNDTLNVVLKVPVLFIRQVPNYVMLQKGVKYIDEKGKAKLLTPNSAREIRFTYRNEEIRMVSWHNTLGLAGDFKQYPNLYLKIKIDGKLKLFNYYYFESISGTEVRLFPNKIIHIPVMLENYILDKTKGKAIKPGALYFKDTMTSYFKDCESLQKKIENKEYRFTDMEEIVNFYNSNCGQ